MSIFFSCLESKFGVDAKRKLIKAETKAVELDEKCEEKILESFTSQAQRS